MRQNKLALACLALGLTGCVTHFEHLPAPGKQTAILKLGVPMIPVAYLTESEGCPKKRMDTTKR